MSKEKETAEFVWDSATTLEEARAWLQARLFEGAYCACCSQLAKVYPRQINAGMAWGLIKFFRHVEGTTGWAHVPSIQGLSKIGGDWAKLACWNLIEESTELREDGGRAGWWRLTELGREFVLNQARVPKYVFIYDAALRGGPEGQVIPLITIRDALRKKFDYAVLMGRVSDLDPPDLGPPDQDSPDDPDEISDWLK